MRVAYIDCEFGAAGDMLVGSLLSAGASFAHVNDELKKLRLDNYGFELAVEDVIRCAIACKKFNVFVGPDRKYETGLYPETGGAKFSDDPKFAHPQSISHTPRGFADSNSRSLSDVREPGPKEKLSTNATGKLTVNSAKNSQSGVDSTSLKFNKGPVELAIGDTTDRPGGVWTLESILLLIKGSTLADQVKQLAIDIFERLFGAEAVCRGEVVGELHMNEMMALDAIIDIVGFSIAFKSLSIDKAFVSALPVGSGVFEYEKVLYSAAAPATLELLKQAGAPITGRAYNNECLTVTGAAILSSVAAGWTRPKFSRISAVGYGAGSYNPPDYPNACRVIIGLADLEQATTPVHLFSDDAPRSEMQFQSDQIFVLEANIDDSPPQALAYAMECLFDAGALDVLIMPVVMKKGRSGHLLKVLCAPPDREKIQQIIFSETTTIGVRFYLSERAVADRKWQEVKMDDGSSIRVKIALDQVGAVVHTQPEYEDCAAYAKKHKMPLKIVVASVLSRFKST